MCLLKFVQASFLGHHRLVNDEFMLRVLDSMSFHKFIEERGPPFRSCDIFDEVESSIVHVEHRTRSISKGLRIDLRTIET
jgi:hypothetical protein